MDIQQMFDIGISLIGFLGGWVLNNIYKAIRSLEDDIKDLPHLYVMKDDYKTDISEVKQMLSKIFDLLGQKADK